MSDLAAHPSVVYVSVVLASALLIVEIALPTFGLAGLTALGLLVVAVVGVSEGGFAWGPLLLCAVGVGLWAVMVARNEAPRGQQAVAAAAFAAGSFLFAGFETDPLTFVLAAVACVGLPLGFPELFRRAGRLRDRPQTMGMESYVGRTAVVSDWRDGQGRVTIDGSWWNARGPAILRAGDTVVITAFEGMCFTVRASAPTVPEPQEG